MGGIGCGLDSEPADEATSTPQSIQGGQLETGFPAVGEIWLGGGSFCTGALIAPDYVLTAAHCAGAGMVFFTGNDLFSFVSHVVDKQVKHPTRDLLLAHLALPPADPADRRRDGAGQRRLLRRDDADFARGRVVLAVTRRAGSG